MRRINFALAMIVLLLCAAHAWAQSTPAAIFTEKEQQVFSDYQSFLERMGYEDFAKQADDTLKNPDLSFETRKVLEMNREKLDVVTAARDLSAFIIARMSSQANNDRALERLGTFVGQALNFGVTGLPDELPPEIQSIQDPKEKGAEAEKFLRAYIQNVANDALAKLRGDVLAILYSPSEVEQLDKAKDAKLSADLKVINALLERIVANKFLHLETSQARFLGRGLALSIVRYARLKKRPEIETRLRSIVLHHGEILNNYITDKVIIQPTAETKQLQGFDLKAGDILMNYSRIAEEKLTGVQFYPESILKTVVEFFRRHIGIQTARQLIPLQQRIIAKQLRGEKISLLERATMAVMNLPIFRRGYNVVGVVDVKVDAQTGLKSTWVYKNYANISLGGIQFEDVRNFLSPGYVDRVGHMRLDADQVKHLTANTRFEEKVILGADEKRGFTVQVNLDERWKLLADKDQNWISNKVAPLAIDMMKKMMVGREAVGYSWGEYADRGMISSAQAVYVAFAAGAGIETRAGNDRLGLSKELKAKVASELKAGELKLISPNTYAWNSHLGSYKLINLPKLSIEARQMEFYDSTRAPLESRTYAIANREFSTVSYSVEQMEGVMARTKSTPEFQYMLGKEINENGSRVRAENKITEPTADMIAAKGEVLQTEKQMREFLFDLGFRDWVSSINERQKSGDTWNEVTRIQQARNKQTFEATNAARELAILMMSRLQNRLGRQDGVQQVANLTAELLAMQPMLPVKKLPPEVLALPEDQQDKAMDQYLEKLLRTRMDEHARSLTADLMFALYGNNKIQGNETLMRRIYDLSSVIVERMYMDHQAGQTRNLGRAMLALLARQAELRPTRDIMSTVSSSVERYGLFVENFLGNEWKMRGADGRTIEKVSVQTLSYVLTRNMNAESATIPWGAQPDLSLVERAKQNKLIGNPLSAALVLKAEDLKDGYSVLDSLKDKAFYKHLNNGFSHIGYVVIKEAKNSKVKMSWVVDNYPHPLADAEEALPGVKSNAGGLRMVGLEQFFMTSHHSRIIVASQDPDLFFQYAKEYVARNGIPKTGAEFFPYKTYKMQWDDTVKPIVQEDQSKSVLDPWKVESRQETLNWLYAAQDAQTFWKRYQTLTVEGFEKNIEKGMIFTWITPYGQYFKGGGYCSSTGVIVAGESTGLTIEPKLSRWIGLIHFIANTVQPLLVKMKMTKLIEATKGFVLMSKMGIIAPNSLAAQFFMTKYKAVTAPIQDIRNRMRDDWSFRLEKSPKWKEAVDEMVNRTASNKFRSMRFDKTEVRSFSHDIHHKFEVAMGKIGYVFTSLKEVLSKVKPTPGVSLSTEIKAKKVTREEFEAQRAVRAATTGRGAALMCSQVYAQ